MGIEKEWKNSRDLFLHKLKKGDFEQAKPYLFSFEELKPHLFVRVNDEWFDYYYNPFTGEKKRVLDKNDFLYRL